MSPVTIVLLVILAVLIIGLVVLYFLGKKAQKKKAEQDEQLAAAAQTVSMLIIDKKRMRITESGLPQVVIDQTPKMMRRTKLPIVKAKVVDGNKELFKFNADESFTDDEAADRYVITYDMKTVATRSDELNSAGKLKYPPQDYEAVNIGSIKTDSTTGTVAQIGYCYGYGGAIGGKVGLGFYSKQSDKDLVNDKYGFTSNDLFCQGNG